MLTTHRWFASCENLFLTRREQKKVKKIGKRQLAVSGALYNNRIRAHRSDIYVDHGPTEWRCLRADCESIVGTNTHRHTQRPYSAYLGVSVFFFFSISDLDWLIYLFVFFLSFILLLFIRFLRFVSLVRRLCCCQFVPFYACTGNNAFLRSLFFSPHTLLERAKTFGSWTSEPNEWMCRILFMSQLSIRWFFSPLTGCVCLCGLVSVTRSDCEWICVRRFFCFESNSFALLHGVNQNKFIYLWFRRSCLFHYRLHAPTGKKKKKRKHDTARTRAHSGECIIHGNTLWIVLEKFAQPEFGIVSFNPIWNWIRVDILDAFLLLTPVVADDLMTLDSGDSVTICSLQDTCAIIISLSFIRSFRR